MRNLARHAKPYQRNVPVAEPDALSKRFVPHPLLTSATEQFGPWLLDWKNQWCNSDLLIVAIVIPGCVWGNALARQFSDQCPSTPVNVLSRDPETMNSLKFSSSLRILELSKPILRSELLCVVPAYRQNVLAFPSAHCFQGIC